MKKTILSCLVVLALFSTPFALVGADEVKVEVLYMNHGPLQSSLQQIKDIFSRYGNNIHVSWYDFETKEGEQFKAQKGITQHVPLVIWLNGKSALPVNGKEVEFRGFPKGSGPFFFQGKWTMKDLRNALDEVTKNR